MDSIKKIAKKYKLRIIEDSSQAHGAKFNNFNAGSIGDIGTFSFYPGKNLGAWGDGGCVTTNNKSFVTKVQIRNFTSENETIIGEILSEYEGYKLFFFASNR